MLPSILFLWPLLLGQPALTQDPGSLNPTAPSPERWPPEFQTLLPLSETLNTRGLRWEEDADWEQLNEFATSIERQLGIRVERTLERDGGNCHGSWGSDSVLRELLDQVVASRRNAVWYVDELGVHIVSPAEFNTRRETSNLRTSEQMRRRIGDRLQLGDIRTTHPFLGETHLGIQLSGSLVLSTNAGEPRRVQWPLRVRCALSRSPNVRLNADAPFDREAVIVEDHTLGDDGSFSLLFQPSWIRRPVGGSGEFDLAVAVLDLEPRFGWAHPEHWFRTQVRISGPDPLPPDLQTLAAVRPGVWDRAAAPYDPIALVRAVNRFAGTDKNDALERLRDFVARAPQLNWHSCGPWDGTNIDQADAQSVFGVVQLLFPGGGRPSYSIGMVDFSAVGFHERDYPYWVVEDFPFLVPRWIGGRTGCDSDPRTVIDWARSAGAIRSKPMRPVDDPVALLERLSLVDDVGRNADLRLQVAMAVGPAVGVEVRPRHSPHFRSGYSLDLDVWKEIQRRVMELGVHWDEVEQRYASGRR